MKEKSEIKPFENLSAKYSIWIIKYNSINFESPLFIVWYTDTDENYTDRLLTFKSGEIFAVNTLTNLKATILSSVNKIIEFDELHSWLNDLDALEVSAYCTYDIKKIIEEIDKNNLDIETIEGFSYFINLFIDYVNQDERNEHLEVFVDNELINKVWNYFYNYIFWPRFNDKEKFETFNKPKLDINAKNLLVRLEEIVKIFDSNIRLVENSSANL